MLFKDIIVDFDSFSEYNNTMLVANDVYAYRIILKTTYNLSNCTIKVVAKRADGVFITDYGQAVGNDAIYVINSGIYSVEGECVIRLSICSADGSVITAKEIICEAIGAIEGGDPTTDDRYPFLESSLAKVSSITENSAILSITQEKIDNWDAKAEPIESGAISEDLLSSEFKETLARVGVKCNENFNSVTTAGIYYIENGLGSPNSTDVTGTIIVNETIGGLNQIFICNNIWMRKYLKNSLTWSGWEKINYNEDEIANIVNSFVVKTDNIAEGAVTADKIEPYSINYVQLADGCVIDEKIADNTIGSHHIENGAITSDKINPSAINDLTPVYTESSGLIPISSGETISEAFSKIYNLFEDCEKKIYYEVVDKLPTIGAVVDKKLYIVPYYKPDYDSVDNANAIGYKVYLARADNDGGFVWCEIGGDFTNIIGKLSNLTTTKKDSIVNAINELKTITDNIELSTEPIVSWEHPRSGEILGTRDFSIGTGIMQYEKFNEDVSFDMVNFPCWVVDNTKTLICRVYELDAFPAGYGFYPSNLSSYLKAQVTVSDENLSISAANLQEVKFSEPITIAAGKVCAIGLALETAQQNSFFARYFNAADDGTIYSGKADDYVNNSTIYEATANSPHRRGFYCYYGNGTGDWASKWLPYEGNYYATTFNLKKKGSGISFNWDSLAGVLPTTKIGEASIGIDKLTDGRKNKLCIPSTIYGVENLQANIYYDNLVEDSADNHYFEVGGKIGMALSDCFRLNPTTGGSYTLPFKVYDRKMNLENEKAINVSIAPISKSLSATVLVMGDSIIANGSNNGMVTYSLKQLLTNDANTNVNLIGTQGSGTNKHEGRAGWTIDNFVGSSSPFYNGGKFDFSSYMTTNSFTACDVVFIHLGINDVFSLTDLVGVEAKFNANKVKIDAIINSIKAYNSNAKVCLLLPIMPPKDANLSIAYPNTGFNAWKYKQRINYYSTLLIDEYDQRQSGGIFVLPFGTCLDTEKMFPVQTAFANSHTTDTVSRQNNLHPTDNGYAQIADSIYAFIKNMS